MGSLGFSRYRPLGGMNWAPFLSLRQRPGRFTGPAYKSSFNLASRTCGVGLRTYFLNPIKNVIDSFLIYVAHIKFMVHRRGYGLIISPCDSIISLLHQLLFPLKKISKGK